MPDLHLPTLHPRRRRENRYVYLVRSRRVGGLSIGINLDPQHTCNFDCVYCEVVDRKAIAKKVGRPRIEVDEVVEEVRSELLHLLAEGQGSDLKSLAYAGDGEPSTFPGFLPLSSRLFDVRDELLGAGARVPLILITNGSGLDRAEMREAHDLFAARGGRFWIKLDAGSDAFYKAVCRTAIPLDRILRNLTEAAIRHPVVVQSMFFRWNGAPPPAGEAETWAGRLADVAAAGGRIALVQVYTVARETMEPGVEALERAELEAIAGAARRRVPGLEVETFV